MNYQIICRFTEAQSIGFSRKGSCRGFALVATGASASRKSSGGSAVRRTTVPKPSWDAQGPNEEHGFAPKFLNGPRATAFEVPGCDTLGAVAPLTAFGCRGAIMVEDVSKADPELR